MAATSISRSRARSRALEWCIERRYSLAVWASMLAWSAVLMGVVRSDYVNFRLGRFDLGNMTQAVWSTAHGHPLEVTNASTGEQMVRLGGHVDPILVLFTPLWLIWANPLVLAYAQVVAVSLGALPVFWLARRHLDSERLACLLATAYLAYPSLSWTAVDAMHPVTLAIPLLLYCIWFLDTHRVWWFVPVALLAVLSGELIGVTVAGLGVWYAVAKGRRRAGALIAVASLSWTAVAVYAVVPVFAGGTSPFYSYYAAIGGSPEGVLRTALTDPSRIAAALFTGRELHYVLALAAPLAGLFALSPALVAVALPQLLANALTDLPFPLVPESHYVAPIVPILVAGTVLGVARLPGSRRWFGVLLVVVLCVLVTGLKGPWPWVPGRPHTWYMIDDSPAHVRALDAAISLIPPGAAVSSTNKVGSHLAARRKLALIPELSGVSWVVIDTKDPWVADPHNPLPVRRPGSPSRLSDRLARSSKWKKIFFEDGVVVFRRT